MKNNLTYLLENPHEDNDGAWVFNLTYYDMHTDDTVTIAKARFKQHNDGMVIASLHCELPGLEVPPVYMTIPATEPVEIGGGI